MGSSWLTYVNLSDPYERHARFVPAMLTLLFVTPAAWALGLPWPSWIQGLLAGTGVFALISIGLSHLSSALGGRLQSSLWPRWPHDSPTNEWLNPHNKRCSSQQKSVLYASIKRLTGLDIGSADETGNSEDLEACINDAVSQMRNRLWASDYAKRLEIHNRDYGFARNFCGLRPIWLFLATASALTSWLAWGLSSIDLLVPIVASVEVAFAFILAFLILPNYVREKARHYAESFFAAVTAKDSDLI